MIYLICSDSVIAHGTYLYVIVYPPVAWRWSDCPVGCSVAMLSLHCVSSSTTATGFVHKSEADNTVRCCVVGPGIESKLSTLMSRSTNQAMGTHGRLAPHKKKSGELGYALLRAGGVDTIYTASFVCSNYSPTKCRLRLYPFGPHIFMSLIFM